MLCTDTTAVIEYEAEISAIITEHMERKQWSWLRNGFRRQVLEELSKDDGRDIVSFLSKTAKEKPSKERLADAVYMCIYLIDKIA